MPTFKYVAKDQNARSVSGKITVEQEAAVIEELRKRQLTIISITPVKESSIANFSIGGRRVKADDLVIFTRQLATMIDAGIPILQALDPALPIILTAEKNTRALEMGAYRQHAFYYFVKPFGVEELRLAVLQALKKSNPDGPLPA